MSALSRRGFLAGSAAAFATGPALAQRSGLPSGEVDCIIVGAGAAGIAAARRFREANRSFILVEASNRIGGRCVVEQQSFGVPFDRGAHFIHNPDINPLTKLAARTGLEIYQAPSAQRIRIGRRNARDGELEDYLAAAVRANRAIAERHTRPARHRLRQIAAARSWRMAVHGGIRARSLHQRARTSARFRRWI